MTEHAVLLGLALGTLLSGMANLAIAIAVRGLRREMDAVSARFDAPEYKWYRQFVAEPRDRYRFEELVSASMPHNSTGVSKIKTGSVTTSGLCT